MRTTTTPQWIFQTWASFGIALAMTLVGAWHLPASSDMAFMGMGIFFNLFACLALSKMLRDNQGAAKDVPSWRFAVWCAFAISSSFTAWGIARLGIQEWHRGFLACSCIFLVSSSFTLAKTLRDKQDEDERMAER